MPNYQLFRTTDRLNTSYNVDRQAGVLRGVVAMNVGEAMGHGVWADLATLHMMVGLGNGKEKVRQRLGHPGISEDATGKQVANANNFRVEGNQLRHDSYMLATASKSPVFTKDVIDYLMTTAEQAPTELGESVVISASTVWTLDDGTEIDAVKEDDDGWFSPVPRPKNALTPFPVLRPVKFHAVDYVSEGALTTDGMFSADPLQAIFSGHSSEFAAEVFDLVDRYRARYHVRLDQLPAKVNDVLERYVAARSGRSTEMKRKMQLQEVEVEETLMPIEEQEDESEQADPVEEKLAAARGIANGLTVDLKEGREQTANRFEQLEAKIQLQAQRIEELTDLVIQFGEATDILNQNYLELSGEKVVSEKVSRSKTQKLQRVPAFQHPAPRYQMATPTHVTERANGTQKTGDAWRDGATRQMAKNRVERRQAGGR